MTYMSLVIVSSFVSRYHPCFTRTTRPRAPAASATHTRGRAPRVRGERLLPRGRSLSHQSGVSRPTLSTLLPHSPLSSRSISAG